jgi:thiol-disulfide isomerase/thioredoxin
MSARPALVLAVLLAGAVASAAPRPPAPAAQAAFERAGPLLAAGQPKATEAWAALAEAITADPDFLAAHEAVGKVREAVRIAAFRNKDLEPAAKALNAEIDARYAEWGRAFPDSIGLTFAAGARLYQEEDPKAKDLLLKVVAHDPGFARAWFMLSIDAERWGDEPLASDYMRRAAEAAPDSPDYAFYHASGLDRVAPERWEAAMREVARRFPQSERGAQALYWLGVRLEDDTRGIPVWEQARTAFPPEKFSWSSGAMTPLFDAYLRAEPAKAVALAEEMATRLTGDAAKPWTARAGFARTFAEVQALAREGRFADAAPKLDQLTVDRRSSNPVPTLLLKAEVLAGAGQVQAAYDLLAQRAAPTPDEGLRAPLLAHGARLGKSPSQVDADLWKLRDAAAKPAAPFALERYDSPEKVSLAGLRGKVVFLTFWFPGCGPCRGEFPHFERVVRQFQGEADLVYLGINGLPQQDAYVLPFMAGTKYSFTPLKGGTSPQDYGVRGYPANFLIDRDGRVVFSNFRAHDEASELTLRRMIEALLARPGGGAAVTAR